MCYSNVKVTFNYCNAKIGAFSNDKHEYNALKSQRKDWLFQYRFISQSKLPSNINI